MIFSIWFDVHNEFQQVTLRSNIVSVSYMLNTQENSKWNTNTTYSALIWNTVEYSCIPLYSLLALYSTEIHVFTFDLAVFPF